MKHITTSDRVISTNSTRNNITTLLKCIEMIQDMPCFGKGWVLDCDVTDKQLTSTQALHTCFPKPGRLPQIALEG
jgi:hypothetical protein